MNNSEIEDTEKRIRLAEINLRIGLIDLQFRLYQGEKWYSNAEKQLLTELIIERQELYNEKKKLNIELCQK